MWFALKFYEERSRAAHGQRASYTSNGWDVKKTFSQVGRLWFNFKIHEYDSQRDNGKRDNKEVKFDDDRGDIEVEVVTMITMMVVVTMVVVPVMTNYSVIIKCGKCVYFFKLKIKFTKSFFFLVLKINVKVFQKSFRKHFC